MVSLLERSPLRQGGYVRRGYVNRLAVSVAFVLVFVFAAPVAGAQVPKDFFGIAPQTELTERDLDWMRHGRIDAIRLDVSWASTQPTPRGFDWSRFDNVVRLAAQEGIEVLPFLYQVPAWIGRRPDRLPIDTLRKRKAWAKFVRAAVSRYGPGGDFWDEHGPGSLDPLTPLPIRDWQIWNEENFFYFTKPASPQRYARLVKISHRALRAVDPRARLILGGLFAHPKQRYPRAMTAEKFLRALYRVPGIKRSFEGIAIHPYAARAKRLPGTLRPLRRIARQNGDGRTGIWITEMGWGSQGRGGMAFEKGLKGQARELRIAYRFLTSRAGRQLNVKQVFWFSWKDRRGGCSFCDSVGLFRRGPGFSPKPAWAAFTRFSGGRAGAPPTGGLPGPEPPTCPLPPLPC